MAKDVIKLAKVGRPKKTTNTTKKITVEPEQTLTPEQERDLKAKKTVEELLEDSPIVNLDKKEEILEFDESENEPKGVEWLEEQITLLTEKNEQLNAEIELAKEEYHRIYNENQKLKSGTSVVDTDIKINVLQLFNEIQENYIKLGSNFRIYCPGFLNRLIKFFPFLEEHKKY